MVSHGQVKASMNDLSPWTLFLDDAAITVAFLAPLQAEVWFHFESHNSILKLNFPSRSGLVRLTINLNL